MSAAVTYEPPRELDLCRRNIAGVEITRREHLPGFDSCTHIIVRRYVGDGAEGPDRARRMAAFVVRALKAAEERGDRP